MNQNEEMKKFNAEFAKETGIDVSDRRRSNLNNKKIEEAKQQMSEHYEQEY